MEEEYPYSVIEDGEIIAQFRRIEDASLFAANREWQDKRHTVSIVKGQLIERSTR